MRRANAKQWRVRTEENSRPAVLERAVYARARFSAKRRTQPVTEGSFRC
jgi:hypothetical protein